MKVTSLIRLAFVVARRRLATEWRLELAIAFGMVLAVALLAGGVVYSTALEEAALQRTLSENALKDTNLLVRSFLPAQLALAPHTSGLIDEQVEKPLEPYLKGTSQFVQSSTFYLEGLPEFGTDIKTMARGKIQYVPGYEQQVRLVEGRHPESGAEQLEIIVEAIGLELVDLSVGDQVELAPSGVVMNPSPITALIVGSMKVLDPDGDFWAGETEALSYQGTYWPWMPMFISREGFETFVVGRYPDIRTDLSWHFHLDREGLRSHDVANLKDAMLRAQAMVKRDLSNGSSYTQLPYILGRYQAQVTLARVPLQLVVALGVCIVLYYVFLVSVLIVRSRASELALLKSRGATTPQLVVLMFIEGLLLAIPAVALGPFVSLGVVSTLGRVFAEATMGFNVASTALSMQSFLLGAAGGILCVLTLTLSAFVTARQGVVEFRQTGARPPGTSFVHRYYLDLLLLALIGLLWWQVEQQGSFLVRQLGDTGMSIDFSLLLGPILAFLAFGLIVLRFFPMVLKFLARLAEPWRFVWLLQGMRQIARDPIMPGALLVLLMLATMLGVMSGTFQSSMEASQRDRALYSAGADVRLAISGGEAASSYMVAGRSLFVLGDNPQSMVSRDTATLTTQGIGESVTVLGVDSSTFADVAWHRQGFTSPPFDRAIGLLSDDVEPERIVLSEYARNLSIWVHPSQAYPRAHLVVRFQDAQGEYFDLDMGELSFFEWKRLEMDLSEMRPIDRPRYQYRGRPPLVIESIYVSGGDERGAVFLDQMETFVRGFDRSRGGVYEETIVLADFQSADEWHAMQDPVQPGVYALEVSESAGRAGRKCAVFSWASRGTAMQGIRPGPDEGPLPAIVDQGFLEKAHVGIGDEVLLTVSGTTVPVRMVGSAEYFPTLYPDEKSFAVVDLVRLADYINSRTTYRAKGPNELWIRLVDTEPEDVSTGVLSPLAAIGIRSPTAYVASDMIEKQVTHPLLAAGWSGLLVLSFFTVVLASASSVLLYSYMDSRARQMEFALLRTLGFSKWQLNGVVWFALVLMVASGIVLGTWVGQLAGTAVLPLLEVAEQGSRATPPMALHVNWQALFWYYAVLAAAVIGTCVTLARILDRREIQQVLRIGGS